MHTTENDNSFDRPNNTPNVELNDKLPTIKLTELGLTKRHADQIHIVRDHNIINHLAYKTTTQTNCPFKRQLIKPI